MQWLTLSSSSRSSLKPSHASGFHRQIAAVRAHRDRVPEQFVARWSWRAAEGSGLHRRSREARAARYGGGCDRAPGVHAGRRHRADRFALERCAPRATLARHAGHRHHRSRNDGDQPAVLAVEHVSGGGEVRLQSHDAVLYIADLAKSLLLGVALGGPLVIGAIAVMDRGGKWWWLYAWVGWTAFSLLITWAFPRFIAPLFNKFSPLSDEALKARVEDLLDRCGFASKGVFVMDGSRRSAHGNAYFTGVGRNKRIVFFDTLLERLGGVEVEAVLAHELGHFRLQHVRQRLLLSLFTSLIALALIAWLAAQPGFYTALGLPGYQRTARCCSSCWLRRRSPISLRQSARGGRAGMSSRRTTSPRNTRMLTRWRTRL